MSKMIERVKAAIAEKLAPAIDMHAPYAKVMVDMAARAAIEALREPTEAMEEAGHQCSIEGGLADDTWKAMIDVVLK